MVDQSIHTAYLKEKATTYDERRFSQPSGLAVHNIERKMLCRVLPHLSPGAAVLEVGCGTGRFLVEMAQKGYAVDGTDASSDMLAITKNKVHEFSTNFQPRLGEAAHLPYTTNEFDFTYCIRLLNQTESSDYALRVIEEMYRVTKQNGYTLVEFMNAKRAPSRTGGDRNVLLYPQEVINLVKTCGGTPIWCSGAFFVNMGIFHMMPQALLKGLSRIDQGMSYLVPQLCTRCYILFHKK